jgi:Tfp pilus assembly protein PilF
MNVGRHVARASTFVLLLCLLGAPVWTLGQQKPSPDPDIPPELRATIPEIRTLLDSAQSEVEDGNYVKATENERQALQLATAKAFTPDIALAKAALAGNEFRDGKFPEAMELLHSALEGASESSNLVLEADVLASISQEDQLKGNLPGAIVTLTQALDIAERSKSPYIRSYVLGQLGWGQFLLGKTDDAKQSLERALDIDRVNGYRVQSTHLVNLTYVLLKQNQVGEAEKTLKQGRDFAMAHSQISLLFFANRAEALLYGVRNEPQKALDILEKLRQGELADAAGLAATSGQVHAVLQTPLIHAITLEDLAGAYNIVGKRTEATAIWKELYEYSKNLGMTLTEAEAALRAAELLDKAGDMEAALAFYSSAINLYDQLQNLSFVRQALVSKSLLLIHAGRGPEALPLQQRLVAVADQQHLPAIEFTAYMVMAEIYQNGKENVRALDVLQKAAALIQDGMDTLKLDGKLVVECYSRMAVAYGATGDAVHELIARERAVHTAHEIKDSQDESDLAAAIGREIDLMKLSDLAQRAYDGQRLSESLIDSEIIFVYNGVPSNPTADSNWSRILNLPFALAKRQDGSRDLDTILQAMGPMLGFARLPILNALVDYYQDNSRDLDLANQYAKRAEIILDSMNETQFTLGLKVYTVCNRAWVLARQKREDQTSDELVRCMALADKTDDKQSKDRANAINILARTTLNQAGSAEASLRYFLDSHPKDPAFHAQFATAFAANHHYQEAVTEFQTAISMAESQNLPDLAAATYLQMGMSLNESTATSDRKKQLTAFTAAEAIYHKQGNKLLEGRTALFIGFYYQREKEYEGARRLADVAGEMGDATQDSELKGRAAWLKGDVLKTLGKNTDALAFHKQAVAYFRQSRDRASEISALLAQAEDLNALHDPDSAIATCELAENKADSTVPPITRSSIQRDLGYLNLQQGEMEKAVLAFQRERDIAKAANDRRTLAFAELSISDVLQLLGKWDDALDAARDGLTIFEQMKDEAGEATAKAELINIYGDRTSSTQDFDRALSLYEEQERQGRGANLVLDVLEIYLQKGLYQKAIPLAKSAASRCEQTHDAECEAHALISLAEVQRAAGDLRASATTMQQAGRLVEQSSNFYLHGRLLYGEANLKRAQGADADAAAIYQKLISLLEGVKGQSDANDQRAVSETYGFIYDEVIASFYSVSKRNRDPGDDRIASLAFKYAEENRARQFAQSWGRTFVGEMRKTLPATVQAEEHSLNIRRDRLNATPTASLGAHASQALLPTQETADDSKKLETDRAAFVSRLRAAYPQYAAVAYPALVEMDNLLLRDGETLVEFKATNNAVFVWIVRKEPGQSNKLVAFYSVDEPREWFQQRIMSLRNALNQAQLGNTDWSPSEELFRALFPAPHAAQLLASKAIIFVPDDLLFVLPLELLSPQAADGEYPLLGVPTRYYPSAASLNLVRSVGNSGPWGEAFLGIGDPITSPKDDRYPLTKIGDGTIARTELASSPLLTDDTFDSQMKRIRSRGFSFERLPGTAAEIQDIARLFKSEGQVAETRLGLDATKTSVLETDLTRYRYIHFATHGVLPTDRGIDEPALVLSLDGDNPTQMFLPMSQILQLRIKADSVVLSACNTGAGSVSRAEGAMSVGRAFLAAGASSVTVSLWQVSDESTVLFMEEYYRRLLLGESKDKALAGARMKLFTGKYKDPFYWAPFIVIGE